jgi:hypothetical protein
MSRGLPVVPPLPNNGATLTVTWSVVTDGGGFTFYASGGAGSAGGGNDWLSYEASQEGGHTGLLLLGIDNTSYDPDDYLQVTLSFSTPQTRLAFSILDVDATNWDDGVEVLYNGTNNVRSDTSLWSFADPSGNRSVLTDNEPGYTGWEGRNDVRADPDEKYRQYRFRFRRRIRLIGQYPLFLPPMMCREAGPIPADKKSVFGFHGGAGTGDLCRRCLTAGRIGPGPMATVSPPTIMNRVPMGT